MDAQARKAQTFKALHEKPGIFVIPNPWDAGSAKMLASLGYQALATTSAGYAFSQGKADGALSLEETLANVRAIVAATDLPVAVDLENGFSDDPAESAKACCVPPKRVRSVVRSKTRRVVRMCRSIASNTPWRASKPPLLPCARCHFLSFSPRVRRTICTAILTSMTPFAD